MSAALILLLASGCASKAPNPEPLVPTYDVINSVKCGLSRALAAEQDREPRLRRLTGNIATVELELKVKTNRSVKAGGGLSTAGVLPYNASLSLAGSRATEWTVSSLINASYKLDAVNDAVCAAAQVADRDTFAFSDWLGTTLSDLGHVSLEKPTGTLDKLTYEASFGVTTTFGGGAKVGVAFVSFDIDASRGRADVQRIKVVISSPDEPNASTTAESKPTRPNGPPRRLGPLSTVKDLSKVLPSTK